MSASLLPQPKWKTTWLWQELERRANMPGNDGAAQFKPLLEIWMQKLETVASSGGTAPMDFTLHDADHGRRVCNRVASLITEEIRENISDYELAFLLLASFAHDIGMTPEREKVRSHRDYLFDPTSNNLNENEKREFLKFLDDYDARAVTLPLCTGAPTIDDLNLADELTTFYVRERHNEWSTDWIRKHLEGEIYGLSDCIETLVLLCESHHFGFDRLKQRAFDPRLINTTPPQILHVRYLACLLRLADILENDPERTPAIIFRHRSIQDREKSVIHWQKDHDLVIDIQGADVRFYARPRSARVYKALEQLADSIDHELYGISSFERQLPSEYPVGHQIVRRSWHLGAKLKRDIQPPTDTYEYIDGAFRPNSKRLLRLLSGEQLYGHKFAAVRELIQNSFDAVREKIARRRVKRYLAGRSDKASERELGDQELVKVWLERRVCCATEKTRQEQIWLCCEDSGVGLTKSHITGHFLISGNSHRPDLVELQRECERAGFSLERTGQFGIGVLSYFMLADEVRLTTSRFQGCDDSDGPGWHFTTQGLDDFGELRKLKQSEFSEGGSLVEMRLRIDELGNLNAFAAELLDYLKYILVRVPCVFQYRSVGFETDSHLLSSQTSWVESESDLLNEFKSGWKEPEQITSTSDFFLTPEELASRNRAREVEIECIESAKNALRCVTRDLSLPNGLGQARLILPYFQLPQGRSLTLLFIDEQGLVFKPSKSNSHVNAIGIKPNRISKVCWKGMACRLDQFNLGRSRYPLFFDLGSAFCHILDFVGSKTGNLEVNREHLALSASTAREVDKFLKEQMALFSDEVLRNEGLPLYENINSWERDRQLALKDKSGWFLVGKEGIAFSSVSLPAVGYWAHINDNLGRVKNEGIVCDGKGHRLPILQLKQRSATAGANFSTFPAPSFIKALIPAQCPSRSRLLEQIPVGVWHSPISAAQTRFPPEWKCIFLIRLNSHFTFVNTDHILARHLEPSYIHQIETNQSEQLKIEWETICNIDTPAEAVRWLCRLASVMMTNSIDQQWGKYQAANEGVVERIWALASEACNVPTQQLEFYTLQSHSYLLFLNSTGILRNYNNSNAPLIRLPEVTEEQWILREYLDAT